MSFPPITWTNGTRRLGDLIPWAVNPREISKIQAKHLTTSIEKFGLAQPFLIGPNGDIYDGHQRRDALELMRQYGPDSTVDVRIASRELSEEERKELVIRLHENVGSWNLDIIPNLYEPEELVNWGVPEWKVEGWIDGFGKDEEEGERGELLDLVDVTIAEPAAQVERGDIWELGIHKLICCDVFRDWSLWSKHLEDGCLFLPYAGPLVTLTELAAESMLLIVQPDTYIAGHIVDRFSELHPGSAKKVELEE